MKPAPGDIQIVMPKQAKLLKKEHGLLDYVKIQRIGLVANVLLLSTGKVLCVPTFPWQVEDSATQKQALLDEGTALWMRHNSKVKLSEK